MNIRHILITTDLSEASLRPLQPISTLAQEQDARVTLLHVVQDLKVLPHGAPLAPQQSAPELAQRLDKARTSLEDQRTSLLPPQLKVTTDVIATEDLGRGIAEYAASHEVDLVALSTHGRTGFRHLALGSVAESVLRHSSVPVLCFPRRS